MRNAITATALLLASTIGLAACTSDAATVDRNLTTAADQFEISRRIIFFNGITDKYLLVIEGRCSITDANRQLEAVCRIGPNEYKKHFLGLSDNVSYFAEQLATADASRYHYRVILKPTSIVPSIDLETGKQ